MTNPAGYPYTPLPARPAGSWPTARGSPSSCASASSPTGSATATPRTCCPACRTGPGEHGVARLRQPGRRLPDLRSASRPWHPADGAAQHRRLRRGPGRDGGGPRGRRRDRRPRPLQLRLAVADDPRRRARLPRWTSPTASAPQEGAAPGGWSSPWLSHTPATLDLLAETGYRYLLDLRLDDQPVWLTTESGPLLAIPYNAEINDSSTMIGKQASAHEFADMIVDEFAELCSDAAPLVMSIVLHSFITGVPFRLARRRAGARAHRRRRRRVAYDAARDPPGRASIRACCSRRECAEVTS